MYNFQPKTLFVGKNIVFLPSCHSTNDIAAKMIPGMAIPGMDIPSSEQQDVFEGTVIVTNHQTAGRGQRGNTWEAAPGDNLTLSLILKPNFLRPFEQFELNIAISLGVHDFLSEFLSDELKIKWPNDIYVETRKIGGILIENTIQGAFLSHSIIGIGLNINQMNFAVPTATSLKKETHQPFRYDLEPLLEKLLIQLEKRYLQLRQTDREVLKKDYLSVLFRYRQKAYYQANNQTFIGAITGISDVGQLQIESEGERLSFGMKEIVFVL